MTATARPLWGSVTGITAACVVGVGGLVAVATTWGVGAASLLVATPNVLLVACGAIIVLRADERRIGWLLLLPGALFPYVYAMEPAVTRGDAPPWIAALMALGPLVILPLLGLVLLYPSGRPVSRGAGVVGLVGVAVVVAMAAHGLYQVVAGRPTQDGDVVEDQLLLAVLVVFVAALVLQVRAYPRRPRRQQLQVKWFLVGVLGQLLYVPDAVLELTDLQFLVLDAVATSLFPVTVLVAILRFRLYEIDRILSRTVAYALVVGLLGVVYLAGLAAVTTVLPSSDTLGVALSTFAAVTLFAPVRRAVLGAVDRRFNRSRYEAARVVDDFGRTVQRETDVDLVHERLAATVRETMQPERVLLLAVTPEGGLAPAARAGDA